MKYSRFIIPGILVAALVFVVIAGGDVFEPVTDLALRFFLPFFLIVWWCTCRNPGVRQPEQPYHPGTAIDARKLLAGISEARESLAVRRPKPDSVQHYRKTLLVLAHQAVAEAGYFKHRERSPDAEHVSA